MKYLLSIVLILTAFTGYSQDKDPLHLLDSTKGSATFDSVYHDVKWAISALADGLKTTADHLYSVLVYQQRIKSICCLFVLLATGFCIYKCVRVFRKGKLNDDYDNLTKRGIACILWAGISGIGFIIVLSTFNVMLTGFLNPEYGALKEIMDFVKQ